MSVFKIEGWEFKLAVTLPLSQTDDIFQLFFGKKDIEYTFEHDTFFLDAIKLFLDHFPFLLVLVLHLKDLFRGSFVLLSQLHKLSFHIFYLFFKISVIVFHEG